jgi:hypothetical protein
LTKHPHIHTPTKEELKVSRLNFTMNCNGEEYLERKLFKYNLMIFVG